MLAVEVELRMLALDMEEDVQLVMLMFGVVDKEEAETVFVEQVVQLATVEIVGITVVINEEYRHPRTIERNSKKLKIARHTISNNERARYREYEDDSNNKRNDEDRYTRKS